MKELEILLNRRWILKSEDKELYYRVRDAVGEIRKYVTDIVNIGLHFFHKDVRLYAASCSEV